MAYAGQEIENPISGERITFRATSADTDGALLAFDLDLSPDGHVPGLHVHPIQEERFEVVEGRMRFRKGLRKVIAKPGDVVTVPPGVRHKFANGGGDAARVRVKVRPALRMEQLLETTVALAKEGRTNSKGMPKLLDLALFMREFKDEVAGPFAPGGLQRTMLAPIAWIARRRGHGARYAPRPATV
jgi:mannose-6-phosphate isomerase-like protein (cupin superfamily)